MLILEDPGDCSHTRTLTPLDSLTYLKSPIDTIIASLEHDSIVSLHDLSDAYDMLSFRLKSQSQFLEDHTRLLPALEYLKLNCSDLVNAFHRDIGRAHVDPFLPPSRPVDILEDLTSSSPSEIKEDIMQAARDTSTICQYVLCTLSMIFRLSALHALFPSTDISLLVDDVVTIVAAKNLPVHNSRKTYSIAIWIFQIQSLPSAYLSPRKRDIISSLKQVLEEEQAHNNDDVIDALKAICNLITQNGTVFLASISDLLPCILSHLVSQSPAKRLQVALVIGRIASFYITSPHMCSPAFRESVSKHVLAFVDTQCRKAQGTDTISMSTLLVETIPMELASHLGEQPTWALSVLSTLIVLSDYMLFGSPRALKLYMDALALVLTHKQGFIRALHPYIWRCLIWAFSRLPTPYRRRVGGSNVKESAFLIVKQDLHTGLGVALAAVLTHTTGEETLSDSSMTPPKSIIKALAVMGDMSRSRNDRTSQEGIYILRRLLSGIGAPSPSSQSTWSQDNMLSMSLFDGTIINSELSQLSSIVPAMRKIAIEEIRQLTEVEIIEHWHELASILAYYVRRAPGMCISDDLVHIWQSLLLANTQLTQGHSHLTAPFDTGKLAVALITEVLDQISGLPDTGGVASPSSTPASDQLRQLSIIDQLWTVMKNVFASSCLSSLAEYILGELLKRAFNLNNTFTRDAWSKLCADLISIENPTFLRNICGQSDAQGMGEVQRELWSVLARTTLSSERVLPWQNTVSLLAIPFGNWVISDGEMQLWKALLGLAVSAGRSLAVQPSVIVQTLLEQRCPGESMIEVLVLLLSHLAPAEEPAIPNLMLSEINNTLRAFYPPSPESTPICVDLLKKLGSVVASCPMARILSILSTLSDSLCLWVEDKEEVLSVEDYNDMITRLYSGSLVALRAHEPSLENLVVLAPFLASAFERIPPPAHGPIAFGEFWKATYQDQVHLFAAVPDRIKLCVRAFDDAYGGNLAVGLSLSSESQLSTGTSVPDSQHLLPNCAVAVQQVLWTPHDSGKIEEIHVKNEDSQKSNGALFQEEASHIAPIEPELCGPDKFVNQPTNGFRSAVGRNDDPSSSAPRTPRRQSGSDKVPRYGASQLSLVPSSLAEIPASNCNDTESSIKRLLSETNVDRSKRRETSPRPVRRSQRIASEPTWRVPATVGVDRTTSLPVRLGNKVFDGVEVPTFQLVLARERQRNSIIQTPRASLSRTPTRYRESPSVSPTPSITSDDYDSWEVGYLDVEMSETEVENSLLELPESTSSTTEHESFFDNGYRSFTHPRGSPTPHPRSSRSVPVRHPQPQARLQRHPRLGTLEEIYTFVKDNHGASQLPVQELLSASTLAHQIGTALTEHVNKKLRQAR